MAEFPIMPLYIDSYMGDTQHLTTIEHGAYMLLLMSMWRHGGVLPNDDTILARCAKLNASQWRRIKPVLFRHLHVESGHVTQNKLLEVYEAVKQKSSRNKDAARRRWLKTKGRPHAIAMQAHSERNAIQKEIITTSEQEPAKAAAVPSGEPEGKREESKANGTAKLTNFTPSAALLNTRLMRH